MKKYISVIAVLILSVSGCGTSTGTQIASSAINTVEDFLSSTQVLNQVEELQLTAPRAAVPGDVVEVTPSGEIDWSGNSVRATGTGVLDPGNPNIAQARLMAERAAVVVAQRNLLETVQGVTINSETRVENFMTDYDIIYSRVDGIVKGAEQTGPATYDSLAGTVEVELEMEIHSPQGLSGAINTALASQEQAVPMSAQTRDFLQQYSALVFDGSQSGLQPSMYPKIYDSDGNLLLDTSIYANYLGSTGQNAIQIISHLDQILSGSDFSQSPLVVQVRQVTGALGTDIVLSQEDSDTLGWLKAGLPFIAGAGKFLLSVL